MEQYIRKSALIAEIEKAIDSLALLQDQQSPWKDGYRCGLYIVEDIIDTLKVKEVDLDLEIALWANAIPKIKLDDIERLATYFFELGLKTKGE